MNSPESVPQVIPEIRNAVEKRKAAGITIAEIARKMKVDQALVARLEVATNATYQSIKRYVDAVNDSFDSKKSAMESVTGSNQDDPSNLTGKAKK